MRLRWYDSIFVLLFIYLIILQVQAIWPFTIDDMYISLRYARNWAAGDGLLWNIHEAPVEGYSNFSFVALAALGILFNVDPVFVLKIAGFFGLLFTCYGIYSITRFWFAVRESLLPCLALLYYKGQIIWAVSGLETTVYQALICWVIYFCFRGLGYQYYPKARINVQWTYFAIAGFLLALAGMTRPETPALMMLFPLLILIHDHYKPDKQSIKNITFFCLPIVFVYVPYFIWRFHYYGYLFANSVYCKGVSESAPFLLDWQYMKLVWPLSFLIIPACVRSEDRRHYFLWLPSLIYLLMLANSDPIVAFDNRLFLPAFILLLPLTLLGARVVATWCTPSKNQTLLYLFFIALICLSLPAMTLADARYFTENPLKGEHLRQQVLSWLKVHAHEEDRVVLTDSGMIPYYSHLTFIDSCCLNNQIMAHYPLQLRDATVCQKIIEEKPEHIILTSTVTPNRVVYMPVDKCLKTRLAREEQYKRENVWQTNSSDSIYRYEVYVFKKSD